MRILIAYDGSDHAKAAIDDLRRAGLPRDARAMVVSVGETLLPTLSPVSVAIREDIVSHRAAGTLVQARAEAAEASDEASVLAHEGSQRVLGRFLGGVFRICGGHSGPGAASEGAQLARRLYFCRVTWL
jgi:nucleotide-binding universal stress UspA family protein